LIEKSTSVAVKVTKSPASAFTVFIEEFDSDNIWFGGQALSKKVANK
jgi:4-oxalocrotonate tautomerase